MNFMVSATTDMGLRKETNQDSFNVRVYNTHQGKIAFAVLCDGMGGLAKGEVASAALVRAFCEWTDTQLPILLEQGLSDPAIRNAWTKICVEFNEKIKIYGKRCGVSMGTTVTAMLITGLRYYIVNVGDTRAYEISEGVKMMTKDQTLVAREVELGRLTPEQAKTDYRRSVLLQCIGASEAVYPEFFFGETKKNVVYMLCSDGFRHEITENEMHHFLNPNVMTDTDCMKLNMDVLIEINKQRQEKDNISVVTIRTL
jgi:serine/threonine protein phosphatase PrpC